MHGSHEQGCNPLSAWWPQGTVEDFDRVIELEPRNALAYSNRGILRAQIGDINRAIEDFTRVIALNRDDILSVYHRALLYIQIKSGVLH